MYVGTRIIWRALKVLFRNIWLNLTWIYSIDSFDFILFDFVQALSKRLENHENFQGISPDEVQTISDYTER